MITSIWSVPGEDAEEAKEIRRTVFVEEMGLDFSLAWDDTDKYAYHLVFLLDGVPVAAGRISYGGVGIAKLGRICVIKSYRGQGIGDGLVKILDYRSSQLGMQYSQLDASGELIHFYQRIGFSPCGEAFDCWNYKLTPMKKKTNNGQCIQK